MGTSGRKALEELRNWGHEPELNPLDALMWRTERPPANSWTGVVVMIFDSAPKWARVVEAHEWAMNVVPRFTEKGLPLEACSKYSKLLKRKASLPSTGTGHRGLGCTSRV